MPKASTFTAFHVPLICFPFFGKTAPAVKHCNVSAEPKLLIYMRIAFEWSAETSEIAVQSARTSPAGTLLDEGKRHDRLGSFEFVFIDRESLDF